MKVFLIIISILLIAIVLLQSNKAEGASQIISGGNSDSKIPSSVAERIKEIITNSNEVD